MNFQRIRRIIKLTLVAVWMVIIFIFSGQPAVVSDANNKFVIELFERFGINLDSMLGTLANFLVRKAAHFTEYFIFFLLLYIALREYMSIKKALIIAIIILFLYACSDEIHQTFVPGREGRFSDVIIDTTGGLLCTIITYFFTLTEKVTQERKAS